MLPFCLLPHPSPYFAIPQNCLRLSSFFHARNFESRSVQPTLVKNYQVPVSKLSWGGWLIGIRLDDSYSVPVGRNPFLRTYCRVSSCGKGRNESLTIIPWYGVYPSSIITIVACFLQQLVGLIFSLQLNREGHSIDSLKDCTHPSKYQETHYVTRGDRCRDQHCVVMMSQP